MNGINAVGKAFDIITRRDKRTNVEQIDADGKKENIAHKGGAMEHLFEIESFVNDIVEKACQGEVINEPARYAGKPENRELNFIKKYYCHVNNWLGQHSDIYRYSTRVEAFYDACKWMGLIGQLPSFEFHSPSEVDSRTGMRYIDLFNALIEKIYSLCQSRAFKERERLRLANVERNRRSVLELEEMIFSEETGRSRWLILSLTLCYKSMYRRCITPEIIRKHRDRFFAAHRFNKLMSGIMNYVWTIEQGKDTGLHLHVILFYSAESNRDEYIAMQVGEYWENKVTEGKGDYWNSNGGKLKKGYKKSGHGIGVGQINWNDFAKREALRVNLVYLAKAEQHLMIKSTENFHTFGMGMMSTKIKSGRPRAK